jgi:hypothetical protein
MRSPDDSRIEAPRTYATLDPFEPSEYLTEGTTRFGDLRLDNDGVRANQLETANVVENVGPGGPIAPPVQETHLADSAFMDRMEALLEPDNWGAGLGEFRFVTLNPNQVRNADVGVWLRRAHEPPIPQPEAGKCSALHQWVCEFIDARDDDASHEPMEEQQAKTAVEEPQVATELAYVLPNVEAPADQGPVAKPPKCFFCPISHQALRDPVVASDGNTYERNFLGIQFSRNDYKSPLTREPLQPVFFPNRAIAEAMHNWAMTQNPPGDVE